MLGGSGSTWCAVRSPHDFYPTPVWCVHRLLDRVRLPGRRWLDPCAGDGAIVRAVPDRDWVTNDIRPGCDIESDWLETWESFEGFDCILTNPPFSLAFEFVQRAVQLAPTCMLLRQGFLASANRQPWLRENTPDVFVLPNRPDFTGGGGDSSDYVWCYWHGQQEARFEVLDLTPLEMRRPEC